MLMAQNEIDCRLVASYSSMTCYYEIVIVHFLNFVFSVLYRRPRANVPDFFLLLDNFLGCINDSQCKLILASHVSIDLGKVSAQQELCKSLKINVFQITITLPTRIHRYLSTLLDVFITNIKENHLVSGAPISDRSPIFFVRSNCSALILSTQHVKTVRDVL